MHDFWKVEILLPLCLAEDILGWAQDRTLLKRSGLLGRGHGQWRLGQGLLQCIQMTQSLGGGEKWSRGISSVGRRVHHKWISRGKCIFEEAIYSGEDNHFQEERVIFKHALPPTFYHSKLLWLCIQWKAPLVWPTALPASFMFCLETFLYGWGQMKSLLSRSGFVIDW